MKKQEIAYGGEGARGGTITRIHLGIKRLEALGNTEMLHCCKLHEDFRHLFFTIGLLKVILYNIYYNILIYRYL